MGCYTAWLILTVYTNFYQTGNLHIEGISYDVLPEPPVPGDKVHRSVNFESSPHMLIRSENNMETPRVFTGDDVVDTVKTPGNRKTSLKVS